MALTKININRMVKEALPTVNGGTGSTSGVDLSNIDYNNLQNKPTIPTTTSQLTNNSGFLTSAPAPSSAQVASAMTGITSGVVGSYAMMKHPNTNVGYENNSTIAGSSIQFSTAGGNSSGNASGTWRMHGRKQGTTPADHQATIMMRIS